MHCRTLKLIKRILLKIKTRINNNNKRTEIIFIRIKNSVIKYKNKSTILQLIIPIKYI